MSQSQISNYDIGQHRRVGSGSIQRGRAGRRNNAILSAVLAAHIPSKSVTRDEAVKFRSASERQYSLEDSGDTCRGA